MGALLAIEASQRRAGVAVRDGRGEIHVEPLSTDRRHDEDLVAAIDRVYARAGLRPADTEAVGVSIGPGGFTGLRVSVSTAKMLAETVGATLVPVPTALVVAESHEGPGPILAALACRGDTFWSTRLQRDDDAWMIAEEGLVKAGNGWLSGIKAVLADRHLPGAARGACERSGVAVLEPVFCPRACLIVASRRLARGETTDAPALTPLYARPPATTQRRGRP